MHVLYFHQHFSSPKGSTGIRSYCMARGLVERGHDVTIVCGSYLGSSTGLVGPYLNGQRRGLVDGINVIELELAYANAYGFLRRSKIFFKYVLRGIRLIYTEKYDLVFATSTPLTVSIPGIFARWLRNKPFIFEVRDLWPELPKAMGVITNSFVLGLMSVLERISYHSANHIVALSPGIASGIEKTGISPDKVSFIPNGCDLDIFGGQTEKWRPEPIGDTDFLVLFSGTHGIANGLDSVLDAANELKLRGKVEIKFLLVGQGKLKESLMERAVGEDLDNVLFLDPINKNELAKLMSSADIGLQVLSNIPAFYYGTSPNKFFDYISAGVPVLNNYPGWLAELIDENDCGFTIPPDDPEAFADTLEDAANNLLKLKTKGAKAKALACKQFDRKKLVSSWVDQLEQVYSLTEKSD